MPRIRWACALGLVIPLLFVGSLPGYAQVSVLGATLKERNAQAGETYREVVELRNSSDQPRTVYLRLADLRMGPRGEVNLGEQGSMVRSNGFWITVDRDEVLIPPRSTYPVGVTVAVPDVLPEAGVGTYWSALLTEDRSSPADSGSGLRLTTVVRQLVQIVTHVTSSTMAADTRQMEFANARVEGDRFIVDIVNTGDVGIRPTVRVELYDARGAPVSQRDIPARSGLIFPGAMASREVHLSDILPGDYVVLVLADFGGDQIYANRYSVSVDGGPPDTSSNRSADDSAP